MTTDQQKLATANDIKNAAIDLIKSNGSTTNLDIKNHLRGQGFWVSQDEVSTAMRTIASEENFERVRPYDGYNTWSFEKPVVNNSHDTIDKLDTLKQWDEAKSVVADMMGLGNVNTAPVDVADIISSKLGIYKQAIKPSSNLIKDLGFIDRDYAVIGAVIGKDITKCITVADISNLI